MSALGIVLKFNYKSPQILTFTKHIVCIPKVNRCVFHGFKILPSPLTYMVSPEARWARVSCVCSDWMRCEGRAGGGRAERDFAEKKSSPSSLPSQTVRHEERRGERERGREREAVLTLKPMKLVADLTGPSFLPHITNDPTPHPSDRPREN